MTVKICPQCKAEFTCKRRDKRCCSTSCEWANEQTRAAPTPSEAMLALGLHLKSGAPEGTAGYRLGLPPKRTIKRPGASSPATPSAPIWFPPQGQRSLRWDRSYADRPYFVLTRLNFEPPRVPTVGTYLIQFVTAAGLVLPTPSIFDAGVAVAEASRMSWPGTHQVRTARQGAVRNVVELVSRAKRD